MLLDAGGGEVQRLYGAAQLTRVVGLAGDVELIRNLVGPGGGAEEGQGKGQGGGEGG